MLRWKISQTSKGVKWSEFTLRGEEPDKMVEESKRIIEKLREVEKFANGE